MRLTRDYRGLPRPSSANEAKPSTKRILLPDLFDQLDPVTVSSFVKPLLDSSLLIKLFIFFGVELAIIGPSTLQPAFSQQCGFASGLYRGAKNSPLLSSRGVHVVTRAEKARQE